MLELVASSGEVADDTKLYNPLTPSLSTMYTEAGTSKYYVILYDSIE